jgi:hypothetical protein
MQTHHNILRRNKCFRKNEVIAAVDFYHCRLCKKTFADLRRIGLPVPLEPKLGFEELEEGNDWYILVCNKENKYQVNLIQGKLGDKIKHNCIGGEKIAKFESEDVFYLDGDCYHKFIKAANYLARHVEITGES